MMVQNYGALFRLVGKLLILKETSNQCNEQQRDGSIATGKIDCFPHDGCGRNRKNTY